jgi:tryptophan synthase alpha chain
MSRITPTLDKLKYQGRKALIPYVMSGFPYPDSTPELMHALVAAGSDIIELGVPFSDPMADGPVIQKAGGKAVASGIGMTQVLAMVQYVPRKRMQRHARRPDGLRQPGRAL